MNRKNQLHTSCITVLMLTLLFAITSPSAFSGVVQGNDSIYTFNVTDCDSNVTTVGCNATTIRYNCSIDPYNFIDSVDFYIDSVYYDAERNLSHFWYDYEKTADIVDANTTISMTRQRITDVDFKSVLDFETVNVNHECDVCDTTYNVTYGTCQINNSQFNQYVANEDCATDYNITEYCNYCTPTWTQRTGTIYDCLPNNTQYVFYDDFTGCYTITGLPEDAPPTDHNTTISCSYYTTDMVCNVDEEPFLTNKINVICSIPTSYQNETFECVTYVTPELNSTQILQSNPEYKKVPTQTTLFNIRETEEEDREYFTETKGIINAYYTKKNIETDRQFVMGVKCNSDETELISEYPITPTYRGLSPAMNRFVWIKDNLVWVGLITIIATLIIFTAVIIIRKAMQ